MISRSVVIGCGGQGRAHAAALANLGAAPIGFFDVVTERAQALAAWYGGEVYPDTLTLLNHVHPTFASVCSHVESHAAIVNAALDHAVPIVFCEKPLARTLREAQEIHLRAEKVGSMLAINHQRRFEPWYQTARDMVVQGDIGELISIDAFCPDLHDWATHWFDMILFFREELPPVSVLAQITVNSAAKPSRAGLGLVHVAWEDGVQARVMAGSYAANRWGREGLVIHGSAGRIELFWPQSVLRRFGRPDTEIEIGTGDPIARGIQDCLECAQSGDVPVLSSQHAIWATEILFASYASAAHRQPKALPLSGPDLNTMLPA